MMEPLFTHAPAPPRRKLALVAPGTGPVAWRGGRLLARQALLREAAAVAAQLPAGGHALNLCEDRCAFAVGLLASAQRGVMTVLPHTLVAAPLGAVLAQWPDATVLVDGEPPAGLPAGTRVLDVKACIAAAPEAGPDAGDSADAAFEIDAEQNLLTVFTSGSTGTAQAHSKAFGHVAGSVACAAERIWAAAGGPCAVVGTSSFRHMYGLESTVWLPLLGGGLLTSGQPLYPADIAAALADAPEPRLLVTTPFHLRTLIESRVALPKVAAVLSATAPLAPDLARAVEVQLGAPLLEIYGATEVGQIATRRPTQGDAWTLMTGNVLVQDGERTQVQGPAQPRPQALGDVLELLDAQRFRLLDRASNLVNIVGKRTSLTHLNHVLAHIDGVRDGVFCLPEARRQRDNARLVAFVVAPDRTVAQLQAALRAHLDPVFLPRPLVRIDALPRDANGKVAKATLDALVQAHLKSEAQG